MNEQAADERTADSSGAGQARSGLPTVVLFGLLLAVQFAAAALTPLGADSPDSVWDNVSIVVMGASLAWPPLLAVWAVFGPQRALVRLPLTLWLALAVNCSAAYGLNRNAGENSAEVLLFCAAWLLAFGVFELLLWLIRAVRRWRLELPQRPDPTAVESVERTSPTSASQFSLRALLGSILAAAVLLGAFRAVAPPLDAAAEMAVELGAEAGLVGLLLALAGLPVVALAWIVLADGRRLTLRIVLSAMVLLGLAAACNLFGHVNDVGEAAEIALLEAGVLLNGLASLGAVRACGYRLRRRSKTLAAAAEPTPLAPVPLSRVRFAFALAPLLLLAAGLASLVPHQLEIWRQADIRAAWRHGNMEATFAGDGTIQRLGYNIPTSISDDSCRRIARVETLQELSLAGSGVDDRQLALLAPLGRLKSLDLSSANITDAGLKQLEQFPQLVSLNLTNTAITDAGLQHLKALPKLKELTLFITDVSDEGLSALAPLSALESIDAQFTAVTVMGAVRFQESHPQAKVEFGASDALLTGMRMLRFYRTNVSPMGYGEVGQSLKLKRLHARGKAAENGLLAAVTDAGLISLSAEQIELEELDLRESEVTDKGIMTLQTLPKLKRLDLRGAPVTEQGVQNLARVLPDCEILR